MNLTDTQADRIQAHLQQARAEDAAPSHTPGPWAVRNVHQSWVEIQGPEDADGSCQIIGSAMMCPEKEANATLMAAAPDMLAMLEFVLARLDLEAREKGEGATFLLAAMRNDIRATIARAKGQPAQFPATAEGELQRQAAFSAERQRQEDDWNRCGDPDEDDKLTIALAALDRLFPE
jgi:hypothetical protein